MEGQGWEKQVAEERWADLWASILCITLRSQNEHAKNVYNGTVRKRLGKGVSFASWYTTPLLSLLSLTRQPSQGTQAVKHKT